VSKINNFLDICDDDHSNGRNSNLEQNADQQVNDPRQPSKSFQGEITFGEHLIESQKRTNNEHRRNNQNQVYE
jgi:hypothetical protein